MDQFVTAYTETVESAAISAFEDFSRQIDGIIDESNDNFLGDSLNV